MTTPGRPLTTLDETTTGADMDHTTAPRPTTVRGGTQGPVPFHRLLSAETRKLFDTRSGMIMTAALIVVVLLAIVGRGVATGPKLLILIHTAGIGLSTLLPVLGILSVTGEWSHHTALTTFTLEPRRGRVLVAKALPPMITALAAAALSMLVAVPVTALVASGQHVPADWDVAPLGLIGWAVTNVLVVSMGLALGMLLLNAPSAILICLSSVMAWSIVASLGSGGKHLSEWLNLSATTVPLQTGHMSGGDVGRLAVSVAFWIVLPMAVGVVRVLRKDVH